MAPGQLTSQSTETQSVVNGVEAPVSTLSPYDQVREYINRLNDWPSESCASFQILLTEWARLCGDLGINQDEEKLSTLSYKFTQVALLILSQ